MKHRIELILAIAFPMVFAIIWHFTNVSYPRNDESYYFLFTQEVALRLRIDGLFEALQTAYLHKHWKPVLHPVLGVPFLLLAQGSVRVGQALAILSFYAVFLAYVYRIMRERITFVYATMGTTCVGLLCWTFGAATTFNSELPFLACVIATFYHLRRIDHFKSASESVWLGFWFAMAACVRPVETILIFSAIFILLVVAAFRAQKIKKNDLWVLGVWILITVVILLIPPRMHLEWSPTAVTFIVAGLCGVATAVHLNLKRLRLTKNFQVATTLFFVVFGVWYAPGAATLSSWAIDANFGTLAARQGVTTGQNIFAFIQKYFGALGLAPWLFLGVGFLGLKKLPKLPVVLQVSLAFTLIFFLPFLAGCLSDNNDVRYYYGSWAMLTVSAVLFALEVGERLRRFRAAVVLSVIALQFFTISGYVFDYRDSDLKQLSETVLGKSFWNSYPTRFDPMPKLQDDVAALVIAAGARGPKDVIKTDVLALHGSADLEATSDPWALTMRAREMGLLWTYDRLAKFDARGEAELLHWERSHFDYLLVGPVAGRGDKYDVGARLGAYLVGAWRHSKLETLGLKFIAKIPITSRFEGESGELLLLKTGRPQNPMQDVYH